MTNSTIRMASSEKSLLPSMSKEHCLSFSDSYNLSQDISQESLLKKPNLQSTTEKSKQNDEKAYKSTGKRRSITDLVERYKSLIQKSGDSPANEYKKVFE